MQRMAWTDERLEERFDGIDRRFDWVDRRFDEIDRRFEGVDRRFDELRYEMRDLRNTLNRTGGGLMVGLAGVIAAVLLNGGA